MIPSRSVRILFWRVILRTAVPTYRQLSGACPFACAFVELNPAAVGKSLLGKRIAVFGGGGKTTLARAIAKKLEVPHIELDAIHHMPNWVERPYDEFAQLVEQRMDDSPGGWVIDGNYRRIRPLILDRADTVIVIQLPFRVMFWRILKRSIRRARTGQPMWNGNSETWRMTFATRESILLEIIGKRKTYANIGKIIAQDTPPGTNFFLIRGSSKLDDFYQLHGLEQPDNLL